MKSTDTHTCTDICSSQWIYDDVVSERQYFYFTSDSVDYQLHEWAEGTSAPPELVDPFRLDWVEWVDAVDRNTYFFNEDS